MSAQPDLDAPPFRLSANGRYPARRAGLYSGASDRQLRYWDQVHLLAPSIQDAGVPGKARLYSAADLVSLREIVQRLSSGESLQHIRLNPPDRRPPRALELVPPLAVLRRTRMAPPKTRQLPLIAVVTGPARDAIEARARLAERGGPRRPWEPEDELSNADRAVYASGRWVGR